jgi:hypothetical protein
MAEVNQIKAVDNHTHVPKLVGPGEKDDDFDALPCDPLEPTEASLMARPANPKFFEAWQNCMATSTTTAIRRISANWWR